MKYCKSCGRQLEDIARFCDRCGKPSLATQKAETTAVEEEPIGLTSQGKRVAVFIGMLVIILVALFVIPQFLYESSHRVGQCYVGSGSQGPLLPGEKALPPCPPPFNWNTFMLANQWIIVAVVLILVIAAVALSGLPTRREPEQTQLSYCPYCGKQTPSRSSFCPHCERALV